MRAAGLLVWLTLSATAVWSQAIRDVPLTREQRLERVDQTIAEIRKVSDLMKAEAAKSFRDLRGLNLLDYVERWAFTPTTMQETAGLLEKARGPKADDAALDRAEELLSAAFARSYELRQYWNVVPQIPWRDRWTAFAKANHLDPGAVDPVLSSQEMSLIEALDSGSFLVAARHSQNLDQLLDGALSRSAAEVLRNRKPADIAFIPRETRCPAAVESAGGAKARIAESGDPEALYPAEAKQRGEHGAIVVRARIAKSSCATHSAVMVSSGYPELDAAALKVAEASRFAAAMEKGKPVDSELTFKVRFDLKEH